MSACGDRIKVEIDEAREPARAYMLDVPTTAKVSKKVQKPTMASKPDLFRYGFMV